MSLRFAKNLLNFTNIKYTLFCFFIVALRQISTVQAADDIKIVDFSALGNFEANFSEIKKVEFVQGQRLIGRVGYMPGENFSVQFPFDVQRINYLVENGSVVNQGDVVATVEGYDAHHFIDEFESAKVLLEIQELHFQSNKQYFENKTIKSSPWIEITKSYYEAKLKVEHFKHQMAFLRIDANEQISLISPKNGIIQIPSLTDSKMSGELAFDIINSSAIKVKITTPLLLASNISHFEVNPTCSLKMMSIDKTADKFHQILWAEATSTSCKLTLGQILKVTPIMTVDGYQIAKSAIFEYKDKNHVAIKFNDVLELIPINLIGANEGDYIFTTKESIEGKQGLVSSVSIIQGSLLKLGAE